MLKKKLKRKRGQSNNYTTPSNFDSDFCLWGQRRTKEREEEEERRLKRGGGREAEEPPAQFMRIFFGNFPLAKRQQQQHE